MASISSLMSATSTYETFVQQLVQIESQKKYRFEIEEREVSEQKASLSAVSKSISEFESIIEEYQDSSNTPFSPFSSSTSDESIVKVESASGLNHPTDFKINISRLAKNDIALSQSKLGSDTDLASFGDGSVTITIGDKTETINITTTKDDGTGTMVDKTNQEIYTSITDQMATLFGDEASASVLQLDDENIQLSLKSVETGYDNRIQFSGATGVLAEITGNVTHVTPQANLDAQFTVDGATFTRGTNTIDDAIEGLTFSLLEASGTEETMYVNRDLDKATENVEDFIEKFNNVTSTIRKRTFINPDTGNKGPLQGMRSIRNLSWNMRQIAVKEHTGVAAGEISRLSDMGITLGENGTLKIDDKDKLEEALLNNPDQVSGFFTGEASPITEMLGRAQAYTESDGILSALENGVDQKLDRLEKQIADEEDYLAEYEEKQRRIFNELDMMLSEGQTQYDNVVNMLYQ